MIYIQLIGGLGNQMFQYALGRSISIKRGIPFVLDISHFNNNKLRNYCLSFFNIIENIANQDQIFKIKNNFYSDLRANLYSLSILPYYKLSYVTENYEKYYTYDPNIFKVPKNAYLDGYWQSYKYFEEIQDIIRDEFTLKVGLDSNLKKILETIQKTESVSLHIRRGDYVNNPIVKNVHGICSIDYYRKAMDLLTREIDNPYFFIFSDDIFWVKENLHIEYPLNFVSNYDYANYIDLFLLSQCKHHIIANSSFSWWGAWLAKNPEKIVYAPSKWVNDRNIRLDDLIPEKWICI